MTRDPEMRVVSNGKNVTQFSIATNEYRGGAEKAEFHNVVTWDRLAQICSQYLGKGQLVAIEGRIHTRQWEDDRKVLLCQDLPLTLDLKLAGSILTAWCGRSRRGPLTD